MIKVPKKRKKYQHKYYLEHKEHLLNEMKIYYQYHRLDILKYDNEYSQLKKEKIKKYQQEHYIKHQKNILSYVKEYNYLHGEKISKRQKKYNEVHKEEKLEYDRNYYSEHKEERIKNSKEYRLIHIKEIKKREKKYYQLHTQEILIKKKEYYQQNKERIKCYQREHNRTETRRKNDRNRYANRKNLSFIPLNEPIEGIECDAHHINNNYIFYIPKNIYQKIYHNVKTNKNMKIINSIAYSFL